MAWPIITSPIESEADVVAVRQRARHIAELMGFDRQDQTRIATAVSEIARNAQSYAGGGRAEFSVDAESAQQLLVIRISDHGKGIPNLDTILEGRYRSRTGMGLGLVGARRLVDRFRIQTGPNRGTIVELGHELPKGNPIASPASLGALVKELLKKQADDPIAALRDQNRELLQSLDALKERQEEAVRLNQELEDTNRGVVALYAELDEKAEQLRQASDLKSRFLSNMSHEFRTPLNSILALARLLLDRSDGDLNSEQERQVSYIQRSANSLLELVNDLLDIAKVEAGKVDVKPAAFTVAELFGALRGALKPLQVNPDVELIFEDTSDIPGLFTDEGKVAQIMRNFISNALKFTERGEVRVSAQLDSEQRTVAISVRDTGIGIAPENHEHIFEEFTQIDGRHQKSVKGTGLGLPLSRKLAELLGGRVQLESNLGTGSTFTLTLPVNFGTSDKLTDGRKRVLVIDDEETSRYIFLQMLDDASVDMIEAANGEEGLCMARQGCPDLIILDLQMPILDGFQVLRELRADPATRHVPVVVSTSLSIDDDLKARLPGATAFLAKKHLSRDQVSTIINSVLRTGAPLS